MNELMSMSQSSQFSFETSIKLHLKYSLMRWESTNFIESENKFPAFSINIDFHTIFYTLVILIKSNQIKLTNKSVTIFQKKLHRFDVFNKNQHPLSDFLEVKYSISFFILWSRLEMQTLAMKKEIRVSEEYTMWNQRGTLKVL